MKATLSFYASWTVTMIVSSSALKIAILTGSTRTSGPPHPILGPRITKFIEETLKARGHDICITLTPRQFPLLEKPYFSYASSQVPHDLATYHNALSQADAYVVITPEMNHAPSPGLINSLNHFGSSVFGFKPSAVVSYSPSQWGGTRAAHALRPVLSELGCLPVSAMIHFPRAHEIFLDDSGIPVSDEWNSYTDRCFSQLEWWTEATKEQRLRRDPYSASPAFTRNPLQRDAPSK